MFGLGNKVPRKNPRRVDDNDDHLFAQLRVVRSMARDEDAPKETTALNVYWAGNEYDKEEILCEKGMGQKAEKSHKVFGKEDKEKKKEKKPDPAAPIAPTTSTSSAKTDKAIVPQPPSPTVPFHTVPMIYASIDVPVLGELLLDVTFPISPFVPSFAPSFLLPGGSLSIMAVKKRKNQATAKISAPIVEFIDSPNQISASGPCVIFFKYVEEYVAKVHRKEGFKVYLMVGGVTQQETLAYFHRLGKRFESMGKSLYNLRGEDGKMSQETLNHLTFAIFYSSAQSTSPRGKKFYTVPGTSLEDEEEWCGGAFKWCKCAIS